MKKISVLVATVIVAMSASFTSCDSHKSASLKTAVDSASYAIGINTGANYRTNLKTLPGGEANIVSADLFRRGIGQRGCPEQGSR